METLIHRYWVVWTAQWLLMTALWFAFVGKVEMVEAIIGVVAAAVAATGDIVIRRGGFAKFRPEPRWLAEFLREPGYVLKGTATIFAVLLRRLLLSQRPHGLFRRIPFNPGGPTAKS